MENHSIGSQSTYIPSQGAITLKRPLSLPLLNTEMYETVHKLQVFNPPCLVPSYLQKWWWDTGILVNAAKEGKKKGAFLSMIASKKKHSLCFTLSFQTFFVSDCQNVTITSKNLATWELLYRRTHRRKVKLMLEPVQYLPGNISVFHRQYDPVLILFHLPVFPSVLDFLFPPFSPSTQCSLTQQWKFYLHLYKGILYNKVREAVECFT